MAGTTLLLDTHIWAWSLVDRRRLSRSALAALTGGRPLWLSPVSHYEITQKARLGKWDDMVAYLPDLPALQREQDIRTAPLTPEIALRAGLYDWAQRDPFDRIIAATAQMMGLPLVSADATLDGVPGGLHRIR